jgi:SAM-dependent methyltransferase
VDFKPFDKRSYPVLPVREGYAAWSGSYEDTVLDLMDLRLLERLRSVEWNGVRRAADLACGTGRCGAWLRAKGVSRIDGIDFTSEMLERARQRNIYECLVLGDALGTPFESGAYDLVTESLCDEHLADLAPLYREASRLLMSGGAFVIVGYHWHFLMHGIITHFERAPGEQVAIESHIHLMSDHVRAAGAAGLRLVEMEEGVIEKEWIAAKPKWAMYRNEPVSFAMVWRKE